MLDLVFYIMKDSKAYVVAAEKEKSLIDLSNYLEKVDEFQAFVDGLPNSPWLMYLDKNIVPTDKYNFKEVPANLVPSLLNSMKKKEEEGKIEYTKIKEIAEGYRNILLLDEVKKSVKKSKKRFTKDEKKVDDTIVKIFLGAKITEYECKLSRYNNIFKLEEIFLSLHTGEERNCYLDLSRCYRALAKSKEYTDYYIRNILARNIYKKNIHICAAELYHSLSSDDFMKLELENNDNLKKIFINSMKSRVSIFEKESDEIINSYYKIFIKNIETLRSPDVTIQYTLSKKFSYKDSVFSDMYPVYIMGMEDKRIEFTTPKIGFKEMFVDNDEEKNIPKEKEEDELSKFVREKHDLDKLEIVDPIFIEVLNYGNNGKFHHISVHLYGFSGTEDEAEKKFKKLLNVVANPNLEKSKKTLMQCGFVEEDLTEEDVNKFVSESNEEKPIVEEGE